MKPSRRKPPFAAMLLGSVLVVAAAFAAAADPVVVLAAGTSTDAEDEAVAVGDGASPARADEDREPLSARELDSLVGPVALYPDDLLAIVLPASTYPLQIVQAARYLEALEDDSSLEPDPDWDESVVALLNYPEVVEKLNEDLDWTWALGQAVLEQEEELLAAVNRFRRMAYAAGNLATDRRQRVDVEDSAIYIRRADPTVIYVPYYEPSLVLSRHRHRVYHYYSRPCPVYYYPYPAGHYLASRHFWGVTGAFGIAWHSGDISFRLLEHRSHPYYGHDYAFRHYWYWRPRLMDDYRYDRHRRDRDRHASRWQPDHHFRGDRPGYRAPEEHASERDLPFTRPSASRMLDRLERYPDDADELRIRRARDAAAEARTRAAASSVRERSAVIERQVRAERRASTVPRLERRMRYRSDDIDRAGSRAIRTAPSTLPRAESRVRSAASARPQPSVRSAPSPARSAAEARSSAADRATSGSRGARMKYRSD